MATIGENWFEHEDPDPSKILVAIILGLIAIGIGFGVFIGFLIFA